MSNDLSNSKSFNRLALVVSSWSKSVDRVSSHFHDKVVINMYELSLNNSAWWQVQNNPLKAAPSICVYQFRRDLWTQVHAHGPGGTTIHVLIGLQLLQIQCFTYYLTTIYIYLISFSNTSKSTLIIHLIFDRNNIPLPWESPIRDIYIYIYI